jgi:hypothetical protein
LACPPANILFNCLAGKTDKTGYIIGVGNPTIENPEFDCIVTSEIALFNPKRAKK